MKKVLLGTLAVLTLAACSKDEVIQQNPNDEITFSVVTNKAVSRAENGFCNKHMPARFVVSASYTSGGSTKQYFLNDRFKKETDDVADKKYVAFETNRYWPDLTSGAKLKFYAATDGPKLPVDDSWENPVKVLPSWTTDASGNVTGMEIKDYEVIDEVAEQRDLLYAVQEVTTKPSEGLQPINFRHALSQIEFAARNENKNIYVEITGVKLVNVFKKGTFTFPTSTTLPNYEGPGNSSDPNHSGPATISGGVIANHGEWTVATDTKKTYTIETKAMPADNTNATVKVPGDGLSVSLTLTDKTNEEYNSQTLYVMPYDFSKSGAVKPWDGTGTPGAATTAYLALKCNIWNVAAGDGTEDTDIKLWDGSSKYIAVLLDQNTKWEPGKRYVYTFVFTKKGNGGIDPDGKPVLTPITLSVTVDDFVDGGNKDVTMNK